MKASTEQLSQQTVDNTIRALGAYLSRRNQVGAVRDTDDTIKLMCDISELVLEGVANDEIDIKDRGVATPASGGKPYISEENFELILEVSDLAMQECERRNLRSAAIQREEAKR
jgi:hypothetical protein